MTSARNLKPSTMPHVNRSHQNAIAVGAPQNCTHCGSVQSHLTHLTGEVACPALNLGARYIERETRLKKAPGRVAIQSDVRYIIVHSVYPSEGPNRSVLIARGSCPTSVKISETCSTKDDGPQTKSLGL